MHDTTSGADIFTALMEVFINNNKYVTIEKIGLSCS